MSKASGSISASPVTPSCATASPLTARSLPPPVRCARSEERCVGKECRSRRVPHQAEDGIRDFHVTGVQTCALPISFGDEIKLAFSAKAPGALATVGSPLTLNVKSKRLDFGFSGHALMRDGLALDGTITAATGSVREIGRALCRERV